MQDNADKRLGFDNALRYAYRLVEVRPRSEKEIEQRLSLKGFSAGIIQEVTEHLKSAGIINDMDFAGQWIFSRLNKPFGVKRIIRELNLKGVSKDIIDAKISEMTSSLDELKIVSDLASKRMCLYTGVSKDKAKQRVYGYLLRRGFNLDIIDKVISGL